MTQTGQAAKGLYDQLGAEMFERLIAAFYRRVAVNPLLRPLYPEADLAGAERRLRQFVIQYFGGPPSYTEARGHPRLRQRHMPYHIGQPERDAWFDAMRDSMQEVGISEPAYSIMLGYFGNTATFMVNYPLNETLRQEPRAGDKA